MHQLLLFLPLLLAQSPGFLARKVRLQRRQSDLWGPWSQWSPCSRTCGGGISVRERPCYSQRGDGGSSCVGPARSHRSCRTEQSCPEGARDFRAEQCAQFDGTEFQGRRYKWLPYYGAPNKCELNCIPKGENFYYKHREAVIDGTPCEPGKQDICVDGSCRTVGCDHKLDSSKQEDKCLQCGGAGTTCYPVTGTFDANDLSRGYNQILIIPMGATSIHIKEAAASRNFLAVKSVHGDYYLNGHWTIGAAGALPVASTILQYERGTEGDLAPEQLHARGPISEPLIIELISQEANPGVHYEYYLPLSAPSSGFRWSHGSWGDCSAECGGGHQARLVFCTIDNEAYPDHLCQHQPRPADRQSCNPQPCPQTKRWKMGPWTLCSASCGGGSQSRSVYCISTGESGIQEAADEAECAGLPGKPPTTQACNLQRCSAWHSEPWGECSVSCGSGVRRRSVTCRSEEGSVLHATSCSLEDRPPLTEACVRADCPLVSDQAWHVGTWGLCSKSCSSGTRKRQVICAIGSPSQCESLQVLKPAETELCNTQPCHLPPEVPSMQGMRSGPRDTRTPLGARESPASEATGGYPRSDRQPGVTPEDAKVPTCQPRVQPHLCSSSHISSPQGWAQGSRTAGTAPTGAVPMATLHLKGLSGKAALETHVSRAEPLQKASAPSQLAGPGLHPQVPQTHRPQAQQNQPSECRGSQFGCCYDNVALAAGPLGEGCVGQPSYAYPVRCLLPSAHGSCADWAARWYFIPSVGQCNRFWYGGCHGNANNFASEQECMSSCLRPQPEASTQATHRVGGPGGQQEAGHYNLGATAQQRPLPSSSLWGKDNEPRPGEAPHGQEQGPSAPGLGGDARQPSRSSSHSLAGSEPALVQATLGHVVRLFCPEDTPQDAPVGWQKDGRPVSSDRHRLQADGSLVISPLQAEDAGTYSCSSTRPGRDSQLIQLRITGAEPSRHIPQPTDPAHGLGGDPGLQVSSSHPRPTSRLRLDQNQPGAVDASAGQQVRLTCHAEGFPPPVIEWQKDGQPLSSPRYQVRPDGSLVISHVAVEDSGFYICVAFNGQDRDQRWVQLRVLGELTITGLPHTVTVPEGDTARLLCMVAGESVNIRWSRNGLPVQADGHHVHQSPDGTLLIYNSRARDEGSYTCSAYRGSQAVSRSTEVKVVPPAAAAQPRGLGSECIDQPELANCDLIVQAQLCGNEYYSSFCCATCSRVQPHAQPVWQQG